MHIDLNCDLGEGGEHDEELMGLVTSVNIACGGHAGDEGTMRAAIARARDHGVAIGAHPGFADRECFGRRELFLDPDQIHRLVKDQVEVLGSFASLKHVKPHGALYHQAARDRAVADAVASAVAGVDRRLRLVGLAGGELLRAGLARDLPVAGEGFADRAYERDGSLTNRTEPGALIDDAETAAQQVLMMVREKRVLSRDGTPVPIYAGTVCLHGDRPGAVFFARWIRACLEDSGVAVRPLE